ncbi:S24 family peptidase [Chishuiella sp.]|uniref:LexA family protein n=1 Tax=Chishuiella sp. TaxID=1969467 RepID=UPI0028A79C3A|nr:S24 family peptidase [Chishuiella sp.]
MVQFIKAPKLSNELSNVSIKIDGDKKHVQFLGDVSAGFPSPASDFTQDSISLDETLIDKPEATYLNRVAGDSMFPEYLIGDLLIVRSDLEPRHNDDIIVSVNNSEYTFKRYDAINKTLFPLNTKYKDAIQLNEEDTVLILGVVTNLVRQKRKA